MNNSKHTPGPWKAMQAFGDRVTVIGFTEEFPNGTVVADVHHARDSAMIAVAPEMLESLKAARDLLRRVGDLEFEVLEISKVIAKADSVKGPTP